MPAAGFGKRNRSAAWALACEFLPRLARRAGLREIEFLFIAVAEPDDAHACQVFLKNNVKTLGYHLAQQLAKDLPLLSIAGMPANVGLKSKACTQSDIESAWFVYWCHQLKRAPV